jgi:hypothetical protein
MCTPEMQTPQLKVNRDSTPDPDNQSSFDNPYLTSSPFHITPFRSPNEEVNRLLNLNPSVPLEVRTHVSLLMRTTEKLDEKILTQENTALKEVLSKRQRKDTGKRASSKDVHCVTTAGLYAKIAHKEREEGKCQPRKKNYRHNHPIHFDSSTFEPPNRGLHRPAD